MIHKNRATDVRRLRIGPIGSLLRTVMGLWLLYLAVDRLPPAWRLTWQEVALGLGLFPLVMVMFVLVARRRSEQPLRLTGPGGVAINTGVIVALLANPSTADAAALFYGTSLLVAAWRGLPGCEATIFSNLILGRDDQIGCPAFTPVDEIEARLKRSSTWNTAIRG